MILTNKYKRISGYQAVIEIQKVFKNKGWGELTDDQVRILREAWGNRGILGDLDMPFMWYRWENNYSHASVWWRLTIPAWCLYYLFCLILVAPFNWLVQGSVYGKNGKPGKLLRILNDWYVHVFDK